jgi:hypothetical protein
VLERDIVYRSVQEGARSYTIVSISEFVSCYFGVYDEHPLKTHIPSRRLMQCQMHPVTVFKKNIGLHTESNMEAVIWLMSV